MKQPDLQQEKNLLETLKAAVCHSYKEKISVDLDFKMLQRYILLLTSLKNKLAWKPWHTERRKHISLLTMFWFSSTGLERNVILFMVAHTVSELMQYCWEESLKRFMHYKTSVRPHFTFNVTAQHKHRIAQIKLEISNLFSPALLTNNVMCFSAF